MTRLTVSSDRLSDGREILYFDEGLAPERPHDRRGLAPARASPTLRYDRLLGEWVTVAGHRQDRTFLPPDEDCPLCPSREGRLTEIPATDYDVVVFENRFPTFTEQAAPAAASSPTCSRRGWRAATASSRAASAGARSSRSRHAGRSRCTCTRTAGSRACPSSTRPSALSSPSCTSRCCGGWRRRTELRCRTSRRGTRRRCGATATSRTSTSSSSRSAARPGS